MQLAHHDDQFVVLEQVPVRIDQRLVSTRLDHTGFVIQFEQGKLAALAVDDPKIRHDARQQLRLTRIHQLVDPALHKVPYLGGHFIKKMPRQIKANRRFLQHQALAHAPGHGMNQFGLLRTGTMIVLATHVKQTTLIGVRQCCRSKIECTVQRRQQARTVALDRVKGAGLDQCLHGSLVDAIAIHPHTKIKQAPERARLCARRSGPTSFARRHKRLDGLLTRTLDGTEPIANHLVGNRLKADTPPVHVGRFKTQAHLQCVLVQHLELVRVVHFDGHVGAEELGRVMHLEPCRVIRQQSVGCRVRLVEAITGELFHVVENFVGLFLTQTVGSRAVPEYLPVPGHLLGVFLAHGTPQHIGAPERIAAQDLRHLHHLLLIHHDTIGFAQDALDAGIRVLDRLASQLARNVLRYQVHRPWPIERIHGDQVFQPGRSGVTQHALHAATFKLEHRLGPALGKQLIDRRVVQRQILVGKILATLVPGHNHVLGNLQYRQGCQAQKVELHQSNGFDVVLVKLAYRRFTAGLLVERTKIRQFAGRNQDATGVHADIARQAFELAREFKQQFHVLFAAFAFRQNRLGLDRINRLVVVLATLWRQLQTDADTGLVRNQLADAIAKGVTHVEHAPYIADHRTRRHGAKGNDLADSVLAVLLLHIVNHPVTVALAEINVEVGHGDPLRIQKALKQQVVLQRVQVGNLE